MDPDGCTALSKFLSKLGLEKFYPNKLTLQSLLEINKSSIYENKVSSLEDIPWCFLRNLFKINAECRSGTQLPINDEEENNDLFDLDLYFADDSDNAVNPLDLIAALFLCADSILQQEMALKMSMCQFSVPLLLPHGNKSQCALMLWALTDIVKEWCPHDLSDSRGFVEDNLVHANIPFYTFVSLKNCSISKSQLLNQVLSQGQQNHNFFIHRDMEGGTVKREIANGLVEVCWYLPCGRENLDIFPKPVVFANLRGDMCESLAQFSLLFQVSAATFVLLDKIEENEHKVLASLQDVKSKLILVVNRKEGSCKEDMISVKTTVKELGLPTSSLKIKDARVNVAEFSKKLCTTIKTSLASVTTTTNIVNMVGKAVELGLSVDEGNGDPKKAAEEIVSVIGEQSIPDYKKQQIPLQGENWKRLAQLEKEECRLKESGILRLEDYKCHLQKEKEQILTEQGKYKLTTGMKTFIDNLSTRDKEKRDFFLKWMKIKLDAHSRNNLSVLRNQFTEQCKKKDAKRTAEMDQALLESSLGIEHYMREMGLIYEVSLYQQEATEEISRLPSSAAEMLLDGYPLELLDGEASNIPEKWVKDVLMEVHKKVGEKSRLLVVSVLGVQSSGKSTLLNTMFGVQFPVSSGRCTRGAFMLVLRVGEEFKSELNCDFIVLIDTEGLRSADMAQLDESYEHDNQLATFVIGLSDVTIINIAMENWNEMKDVLQIVAHAFLRMKKIGKKPVCHFVHQNVAGISAHSKLMTERKHLLDQLNKMTQMAAEMEKQPSVKAFTDVLDYDIEKNNWTIPGLWHGTPPMAPVNTGYSEAVAEFKKHLLETMKGDRSYKATQIPDFLEWMKNLWKAVKYENFIFSFRNTLVAHTYDTFCKEFNQWGWEFQKEILSWQEVAELEIKNADNKVVTLNILVAAKKCEVSHKITDQKKLMQDKVYEYYKRKDQHINLIEKYKADFVNSTQSLANEIQQSVNTNLDRILEQEISKKKAQDLKRKYRGVIEEQVLKLLRDCKEATLSDEELTQEFKNMWDVATADVRGLKERDIAGCVLKQLRQNFSNLNVNEALQEVDLTKTGREPFKTQSDHVDSSEEKAKHLFVGDLQSCTDSAIEKCRQLVLDKVKTSGDYHDSFTRELLEEVDTFLKQSCEQHKTNTKFEIDLKVHVCGIATREFLKMHQNFLSDNSPKTQLERHKTQYLSDFLDSYKQKDHCQRKATDFVRFCIKPAVENYINRSLGINIVDEILTSCHSAEYSTRSLFQYNIQNELLQKDDFDSFVEYIINYKIYVKEWIFQQVRHKMSEEKTLCKLQNNTLRIIVKKIEDAIEQASKGQDGVLLPDNKKSITQLISNMRKHLNNDISISVEDEKTTLFQIQSTCHPFIKSLKSSLENLKKQLEGEFSKSENITETLLKLPIKPQNELFKRVFGCGKQCPFCKVPCEAGGKEHMAHHAAVHRPQGLQGLKVTGSNELLETLCTTDVHSDRQFRNKDTKNEWHPYKDYKTYYPDWNIPPDSTIEASDYWKYILVKYNDRFAKEHNAKPANVPQAWLSITKEQALRGLKVAFNIK